MSSLQIGLSTAAVGITVVFIGLIILIGMIYVMTMFTRRTGKKKAEIAPPAPAAPVPAPAAAPEETAEDEDDGNVIAAITAAIACVWQDESTGFVVRRVRRIQNSPAWQRAGREEQAQNRF